MNKINKINKIKSWLFTGKNPGLVLIVFCFLIIIVLFLVWMWKFRLQEGLYMIIPNKTAKNLDVAVDAGVLSRMNDVPNSGAPIVLNDKQPVAKQQLSDPEFPSEGSIIQCLVDDINDDGSYYYVSGTNPKTINLFPSEDSSIINSWSNTWASAPVFKNCSSFLRGPTMEKKSPLPNIGTDIQCRNEDSDANRHTYRVMSRTRIQPFPGYEEDPNQIVAKSWGVNENNLTTLDDCSKINRVKDNNGNVKIFKYKVNVDALEGKLVRCRQSVPGSNRLYPENHSITDVYKMENKLLRWFQDVPNAYTSYENIKSWGLEGSPLVDIPSCDDIQVGANIRYNIQNLPDGTYTKCAIDVPGGAGIDKIYRVINGKLSWTVSSDVASYFYNDFNGDPNAYKSYPDCSSFQRGEDITKDKGFYFYRDFNGPGTHPFTIPEGCIGIHAITIGGGGGGGGGGGSWYEYKQHSGGGGAGGGGGGGAVACYYVGGDYFPIDDENRYGTYYAVVGSGGVGGRKGDKKGQNDDDTRTGKSTPGTDGGASYFVCRKNNIESKYFIANGGKGGKEGVLAKDWRGKNGDGGAGGVLDNQGMRIGGNSGNNGITIPQNGDPYHNEPGGDGGNPVHIPSEVPGRNYGRGGKGGTGSISGHDQATNGTGGTGGFVRIIYMF